MLGNIDTLKTRVIIYNTGQISWMIPLIVKARCVIEVKEFPFDTQYCSMKFGSWTYDASLLNLTTTYGVEQTFPSHLEWNITRAQGVRDEKEHGCCPGLSFPSVTFHVDLQRRLVRLTLNRI